MTDLHHIPNVRCCKRLIKDFKFEESVAIALPSFIHKRIKYSDNSDILTARQLLAKEIMHLRKTTDIPPHALSQIIELNKKIFPSSFNK
jgi:hypothetical protein